MKFKTAMIVFAIATAVATIPVLLWANAHQDWIQMIQAPLFGLTLAIAVATAIYGLHDINKACEQKKLNGLFDDEDNIALPYAGILLLALLALISLGYDNTTVDGSGGWLLIYHIRWGWIILYGLLNFFWWLFMWMPSGATTGWKVSLTIPTSMLVVSGLTSGRGYFNLHGLILAGATFAINLVFFVIFAILNAIAKRNASHR